MRGTSEAERRRQSAEAVTVVETEKARRESADMGEVLALDLLVVPKVGRLPEELRAADLLRERFLSVVRQDHPVAQLQLTLGRFCALQHVVVYPLGGDADRLVSRVLTQRGLERRVAVRVPYFESAVRMMRALGSTLQTCTGCPDAVFARYLLAGEARPACRRGNEAGQLASPRRNRPFQTQRSLQVHIPGLTCLRMACFLQRSAP